MAAAVVTSEPYAHLINVFASTYDLGQAFIMREDMLDALEKVDLRSCKLEEMMNKVQKEIATLQCKTEEGMEELKATMTRAIQVQDEESYRQVSEVIKSVQMPVPFDSLGEAEAFLGANQTNRYALRLAFSNSEVAMAAKASIKKQVKKRFPASVIMDFLFAPHVKHTLRVRGFGPQTRSFLADRGRWLMDPEWRDTAEETILVKMSKHIHYADSVMLRRSARFKK